MPTLKQLLNVTDAITVDAEPHTWHETKALNRVTFTNQNTSYNFSIPLSQEAKQFKDNSWLFTTVAGNPVWLDLYKFSPVTLQDI